MKNILFIAAAAMLTVACNESPVDPATETTPATEVAPATGDASTVDEGLSPNEVVPQ